MNKFSSFKLNEITVFLEKKSVQLITDLNENISFNNINSLINSMPEDLTFFHNNKYLNDLKKTKAKACLINKKYLSFLNKDCAPIVVDDPYLAYALITNYLSPAIVSSGKIHNTAIINKNALISSNVQINANVIINDNCIINNDVIVFENSVIGPNVVIGDKSKIMSNCEISNTELGKNCFIQSGVVIGGKGFGFTPLQKIEIKHVGNVKIGNNVDIGSNTTIDRGTIDSTEIGNNCRIDNLVQIAHNVKIGENSIIVSQTGISGSTTLGKNCIVGGQAGISGHLTIGNNVKIAAKSGVIKGFGDNSTIGGFPARDIKIWKKAMAKLYKDLK